MQKRALHFGLVFSLLLHAFLLFSVWFYDQQKPQPVSQIEIEIVEPSSIPEVATQTVKEPSKVELSKQIVDQTEQAINDDIDPETRFLSKNNQKVIQQSVAQKRGEFINSDGSGNTEGSGAKEKSLLQRFSPQMNLQKAMQEQREQDMAFDEQATEKAREKAQQQKSEQKDLRKGTGGSQASQTLDYIKELEPGLETLLSTKEFVYYSFYARVRGQLQQHWSTMVRERLSNMYKQGRSIASSDDKITKLLVTLNTSGTLVRIQIIGDSGVRDLDEAAVEAFKKAAPFPNPPKGMVDEDGTIKIRWDFILEASLSPLDAPHLDSKNNLMIA